MSNENKVVELNEEELKEVSGGDLYGFETVDESVPAPGKIYINRLTYPYNYARVISFDKTTELVEFEICEMNCQTGLLNSTGNDSKSVYDFLNEYELYQ